MKIRLIVGSILAIMVAAGASYGQQTRLLVGTEGGLWRGVGNGTLLLTAGEAVQLRHVRVSGRVTSIAVDVSDPSGGTYYQVPCEDQSNASRANGISTASLTISGTISEGIYRWATDKRWKGTCGILAVRLSDGSERRARIRFQ